MGATHDVIVIGGSFAGLAAATYVARSRRSVMVIDDGRPRSRYSEASHGLLSRDGSNPVVILRTAREQLSAYPTVHFCSGSAVAAGTESVGFAVQLAGGDRFAARKLILAFGLRDTLPAIPGFEERWGTTVLHCPYCHGFELRDRELGVLYRTPMSLHQAMLVAEWGPTTLFMNGIEDLDRDAAAQLAERGVKIEAAKVTGLSTDNDNRSTATLSNGQVHSIDAMYISPQSSLASPIAEQMGCAIEEGPLGPIVSTNADRMTSVAGVYAVGDIARAPHSVSWAVADGVTAATAAHRALVFG